MSFSRITLLSSLDLCYLHTSHAVLPSSIYQPNLLLASRFVILRSFLRTYLLISPPFLCTVLVHVANNERHGHRIVNRTVLPWC
ncbi:hypothetical protein C8J57DRAFT_1278223, partial [Mycena rebaudengoi]